LRRQEKVSSLFPATYFAGISITLISWIEGGVFLLSERAYPLNRFTRPLAGDPSLCRHQNIYSTKPGMEKSSFILSVSTANCINRSITRQRAPAVITLPDLEFTEGKNRIILPANKGCMEFVKWGDQFSKVVLTDVAGYTTCLVPMPADLSTFACEDNIPDTCFGLPDSGETALCFCRTAPVYKGTYSVIFRKAILYAL
jgi:hypothetical protein